MPSNRSLSIIIPAYNEEENIQSVLTSIRDLENKIQIPFEVIVVDDGSTDKTAQIASSFEFVKVERNRRNLGKGAAVRRGLEVSMGDIIVIQDADLEYFPSEIPVLVWPLISGGAEVVYGSRFLGKRNRMIISRYIGNRILSIVTSILYCRKMTDVMTGHKAFTRCTINSIQVTKNDFSIEVEITSKFLKKKFKIKEVQVRYESRKKGVSKLSWKDGVRALMLLIKLRFSGA